MKMAALFRAANSSLKLRLLAFWDFLVLFSGISTASNLSRTRKDPIQSRGVFLFRKKLKGSDRDEFKNK